RADAVRPGRAPPGRREDGGSRRKHVRIRADQVEPRDGHRRPRGVRGELEADLQRLHRHLGGQRHRDPIVHAQVHDVRHPRLANARRRAHARRRRPADPHRVRAGTRRLTDRRAIRASKRRDYAACMPLYRLEEPSPALTAPVVVAAFDGWIDAAGAASSAADQLARGSDLLATFEDDVLFDYRSRRPTLDVVDGTLTRLVWPTLEVHRRGASGRDLLVLHGAEPDFRWKELANDILELCLRLGVVEWVSLGAIPAA